MKIILSEKTKKMIKDDIDNFKKNHKSFDGLNLGLVTNHTRKMVKNDIVSLIKQNNKKMDKHEIAKVIDEHLFEIVKTVLIQAFLSKI